MSNKNVAEQNSTENGEGFMGLKYERVAQYTDDEISSILKKGKISELKTLALSLGEYHEDFEFAQETCFSLLENSDEKVRVNAVLGLSYLARNFRKLDIDRLLNLLKDKDFSSESLESIHDYLEDISLFLNVKIDFSKK